MDRAWRKSLCCLDSRPSGLRSSAGDDFDSIYVGIRIIGSVPPDTYAVVLSEVPGTTIDDWHIDAMPQRANEVAEVVWSAIMDPVVAESFLSAD